MAGQLPGGRVRPGARRDADSRRRCPARLVGRELGRHRGAEAGGFALIAGFVDIGESFEDAVRREVAEETGVPVGGVRYAGSQAWPYPSGIMVGFLARAASDAISVDGDELVEARWFTRAALAAHRAARPRTHGDSIGTHLLDAWLAAGD